MMDIIDAIGKTPFVELKKLSPKGIRIFAKLEGQNVGGSGSVKDRIAKYMIKKAEEEGKLKEGSTIIEATSGNTGIALAMIGKRKGYRVKIVIPDNASRERIELLRLYGAEVIFTEGEKGVNHAIEVARKIAENEGYFMPDQFSNPYNPLAHYETTGKEILDELGDIKVDALICGLGTGGTIMGVGKRLREVFPDMLIIGVEPYPGDPIPGLRNLDEGFIPSILDLGFITRRVYVSSRESYSSLKELLDKEGIFAGLSSGAVIHEALKLALEMGEGNIVVILPDGGWKYLSLGIEIWTKGRPRRVEEGP